MGIQGLLPYLKRSSRPVNLSEFKGKTAVVDVYCWLHKGAFSCAEKLVKGEATDGYLVYVMKQVNLLLSFDIKPILVFDGCHLPAKESTESKRRESRKKNRLKAKELLREGKIKEARECFQRCVDITSSMAHEVIKSCRARNIDTIVAPYEADAQLAFFNLQGIADIVITEDSDLVLFGCDKIIFKLDSNGGGVLVEKEKLNLSMNLPRDKFDFMKFRNMCILSGCDYLPSLHGIGLAKACRFFTVTSNPDVFQALTKLPGNLKMPHLEVTLEYRKGFLRAIDTILHQLVFDPFTLELKPLTPYPSGASVEDFPYCGNFLGHERAHQIALGNVDVQTGETVDNYDPLKSERPPIKSNGWNQKAMVASHPSIWDPAYLQKRSHSSDQVKKEAAFDLGASMRGKEYTVSSPVLKRKRESSAFGIEVEEGASEENLQSLYCKKQKSEEESIKNIYKKTDKSPVSSVKKEESPLKRSVINEMKLSVEVLKDETSKDSPPIVAEEKERNNDPSVLSNYSDDCGTDQVKKSITLSPDERKEQILSDPEHTPKKVSKNPFAKTIATIKAEEEDAAKIRRFSALSRFSRSPKKSTIVLSRYFKDSKESESNEVSIGSNLSPIKSPNSNAEDKTSLINLIDSDPSPTKTPLKPKNVDISPQERSVRKSAFKWEGGLSDMFSCQKNKFLPKDHSPVEKSPSSLSWVCNTPPQSQSETPLFMEDEDESLSQKSIQLEEQENQIQDKIYLTPKEDSKCLNTFKRHPPSPGKVKLFESLKSKTPASKKSVTKCRVSGLRKSISTPKEKQLNLREMFSFKKDVTKIK